MGPCGSGRTLLYLYILKLNRAPATGMLLSLLLLLLMMTMIMMLKQQSYNIIKIII